MPAPALAAADWLPFFAGVIGAASGLGGSLLVLRSQRGQQRSARLAEAAGSFAERLGGTADAVAYALRNPGDEEGVKNARWLVGELSLPLARVKLFFGAHSDVISAAEKAVAQLRAAAADLRSEAAGPAYQHARAAEEEFLATARGVIER